MPTIAPVFLKGWPFPVGLGSAWDGATYDATAGTFSASPYSPDSSVSVPGLRAVGAGTSYPIAMSKAAAEKLTYRIRSWDLSQSETTTFGGTVTRTAEARAGDFFDSDPRAVGRQMLLSYGSNGADNYLGGVFDFNARFWYLRRGHGWQLTGFAGFPYPDVDPGFVIHNVSVSLADALELEFEMMRADGNFYPFLQFATFVSVPPDPEDEEDPGSIDYFTNLKITSGTDASVNGGTCTLTLDEETMIFTATGTGAGSSFTFTATPKKWWPYEGFYDEDTGLPV